MFRLKYCIPFGSILALFVCLSFSSVSAWSRARGEEALVLSQVNDVTGPLEVYLTKSAMKLVYAHGVVLVVRSPEDKVCFYNPEGHLKFETTVNKWRGTGTGFGAVEREPKLASRDAHEEKLLGLNARHLIFDAHISNHKNRGADFWYSADVYPKAFATVLQRNYVLPQKSGIPLRYVHIQDYVVTNPLQTKSIRRMRVASSFFDIPSGLQPVKSAEEVQFATREKEAIIQDLF